MAEHIYVEKKQSHRWLFFLSEAGKEVKRMKRYRFASTRFMKETDLRDYEDIILKAAREVIPEGKVKVYKHYYTVMSTE